MTHPLLFVLAPAGALPGDGATLAELEAAQLQGPAGGFALRIFSQGRDRSLDLAELPLEGQLTGTGRRSPDGTQLLCDAVVPHLEPHRHWLGVYRRAAEGGERFACLDRLALGDASNETCWFYPTHDGTFLSWERGLGLSLSPGTVAAAGSEGASAVFEPSRIAVLWSLLGDDVSLTCVGLTYGGQRIDWPMATRSAEPTATWSRFRIDGQADPALRVEETRSVFAAG